MKQYIRILSAATLIVAHVSSQLVVAKPVLAVSPHVVISSLQTAGPISGTSAQEVIVAYNSSTSEINVSGWCIFYGTATMSTTRTLACLDTPINTELRLASSSYMSFASTEFIAANIGYSADAIFSGGLAATGGHVWIKDQSGVEIDRVGWGTASAAEGLHPAVVVTAGMVLQRDILGNPIDTDDNASDFTAGVLPLGNFSGLYEHEIAVDVCPNIEELQLQIPEGMLIDDNLNCILDACLNLDELQIVIPADYEDVNGTGACTEMLKESAILVITEILPNVSGADGGYEFVEIYNPNDRAILLDGYKLQVGPMFTKQYIFSSGVIAPKSYAVFSDFYTGIVLPNTTGVALRLIAPSGDEVSLAPAYVSAVDNESWALIGDQWAYTNQLTPAALNQGYLEDVEEESGIMQVTVTSTPIPCAAGKIRNPLTNRCKSIATAVSALSACSIDQYRNPDTNRCRKVTTTSSTLTPCKEGQERNPETNRCRKSSAVLGANDSRNPTEAIGIKTTQSQGNLNWPVLSVTVLGTIGYVGYEWRSEIMRRFRRS